MTLPGVGRKTANVVLGNAFGIPGITVDTHFGRLARRFGFTEQTDPVKAEHEVGALFPKRDWTMLSHHLIWHGRRVCHARNPACGACPVARWCPAYGEGPTDPVVAAKLVRTEGGRETRRSSRGCSPACCSLAGCSAGIAAARGRPRRAAGAGVDVDTPQLRALKKEAGVEPCVPGPPGDRRRPAARRHAAVPRRGPRVDLSALRGPLVVNLFAQWCGPCREELPYYQGCTTRAAGTVRRARRRLPRHPAGRGAAAGRARPG